MASNYYKPANKYISKLTGKLKLGASLLVHKIIKLLCTVETYYYYY